MSKTHTLLATIGISPQVVTETLYAIHRENGQWPDDICLITTSVGKANILKLDFASHLQRLCSELQRPLPAFDESHILVTPGADGHPVEDARSIADHEAMANFIMTEVRNRTATPDTSLHASLAGGRKTMTFYIGYAMSLFGRPQDTLSHVLVSDGYEGNPGFWFPTPSPEHRHLKTRDGTPLDASDATVTLAPIPFIRHRHDLPEVLLQNSSAVNFAELVQLINLGENPQSLQLEIDQPTKTIRLLDHNSAIALEFTSGLLELAFYSMMARATLNGETDLTRPGKNRPDNSLVKVMLEELMPICGLHTSDSRQTDLEALKEWNDRGKQASFKENTLDSLEKGMADTWFDQRKNQLGKMFEQRLPASLARWLVPSIIWKDDGTRLETSGADKTPKGGGYGINLQRQQIRIIEVPTP